MIITQGRHWLLATIQHSFIPINTDLHCKPIGLWDPWGQELHVLHLGSPVPSRACGIKSVLSLTGRRGETGKEAGEVSWRKRGRKPRLQKNRPNLYLLYKYTMKIFLNIIPVSGINLNFEGTAEFLKKPEGAWILVLIFPLSNSPVLRVSTSQVHHWVLSTVKWSGIACPHEASLRTNDGTKPLHGKWLFTLKIVYV